MMMIRSFTIFNICEYLSTNCQFLSVKPGAV